LSSTNRVSPLGNGLEHDGDASIMSGATSVQEPSGAVGAGAPKMSGLAETFGSWSAISAARR
jgi:hypothetical protein